MVVVAVLVALACRDPAGAPVVTGRTVDIAVDDDPARAIVIEGATPLHTLVPTPAGSWFEVVATTRDEARTLELPRPATTYAGNELRVYLDQGRPALGVFRQVDASTPGELSGIARQPLVFLADVTAIHVRTRPLPLPLLAVTIAGREVPLDSDRLRALPKVNASVPRERGWRLFDVIALASPPTELRSIRLHTHAAITPIDLATARSPDALLKQNQRGEYVFRVWDNASARPRIEVRGVTRIEIN